VKRRAQSAERSPARIMAGETLNPEFFYYTEKNIVNNIVILLGGENDSIRKGQSF